jgi:hypothetical protein
MSRVSFRFTVRTSFTPKNRNEKVLITEPGCMISSGKHLNKKIALYVVETFSLAWTDNFFRYRYMVIKNKEGTTDKRTIVNKLMKNPRTNVEAESHNHK